MDIRSYITTPNISLPVLARVLPMDLHIKKRSLIFKNKVTRYGKVNDIKVIDDIVFTKFKARYN